MKLEFESEKKPVLTWKYISLMLVLICSFIGAGFVSGAEIYEFFVRFKAASILGVILFFFMSFLLCRKVLKISSKSQMYEKNDADSFKSNFDIKMHKKCLIRAKNTFLIKNYLKKLIVFCNCFFISGAMMSGMKNLISQFYNHIYFAMFFGCVFFSFVICILGVRGLDKIDFFVIGFVALMCFVFVSDNSFGLITNFKPSFNTFDFDFRLVPLSLFFSATYVFMNIMQFEPVVENSGIAFSKRRANIFSLVFSLLLSVPLLIFVLFLLLNPSFLASTMPFLEFFVQRGGFVSKIFAFGLLVCLLTTFITCLIGMKSKISEKFSLSNFISASVSLFMVLVVSVLPFKFFVSVMYPILGVLNCVVFVFL